jgi:DNA mismatch repair protein MutL
VGKIRVLPEVVASQVAAGEVVERPASVIKELMENSLDAGARSLEIEVRGAGTGLLRVTDDGGGMDREDALLALERHATSKIATAGDLALVQTMGFRGEALPSIASVSEFTLRTRPAEAAAGTEAVVKGGKMVAVRDAGCASPRISTTRWRLLLWRVRVCRCIMSAMGGPFFAPARRGIPRGG